jgi:hypothetical protein
MRKLAVVAGLVALTVLVGATVVRQEAARGDIFATYDQSIPPSILLTKNAVTGAGTHTLPAGVDLPGSHLHPSLSPNGRFVVFLSIGKTAPRIIMVDRRTGQSADLLNAFEAAADPPLTPVFSLDGTKVITGRRLEHLDAGSPPGALQSSYTETSVTNFPSGPFPHRISRAGGADSSAAGTTLAFVPFGTNRLAFATAYQAGGSPGRITVRQGTASATLADTTRRFANPTVSTTLGVVVFESAPAASPFETKLVFRPLNGFATSPTTALPSVVNAAGENVSNPTFTRDGRYLVFHRRTSSGFRSRFYVWDTQTQLLLNRDGVSGGPSATVGGFALELRRVLANNAVLSSGGLTGFTASQGGPVGLLIQRIIGRHKLLGHTAPKLATAGRVPLGSFTRGRHTVRWPFTLNGRRLPHGCYLVTLRALTATRRQVRDLVDALHRGDQRAQAAARQQRHPDTDLRPQLAPRLLRLFVTATRRRSVEAALESCAVGGLTVLRQNELHGACRAAA